MKRTSKDLNACISFLKEKQSGDDVTPEQKQAIEDVLEEVRRIRRKPNLDRHEMFHAVRRIAETLIHAFFRK